MRIQETNRILKDAGYARHANHTQEQHEGMMTKAWKMISALPGRVTGLFKH